MRKTNIFDMPGRMLSGSKIAPEGHVCVWNANVLTKSRGKFWFGDLDLTTDAADLQALADKEGETVFVLKEMDARFENAAAPRFDRAVAKYDPHPDVVTPQHLDGMK